MTSAKRHSVAVTGGAAASERRKRSSTGTYCRPSATLGTRLRRSRQMLSAQTPTACFKRRSA